MSGPILAPSSYFMKTPPQQYTDDVARQMTETYIAGPAAGPEAGSPRAESAS
jgi:myo-inositol-1-phosphate synthase